MMNNLHAKEARCWTEAHRTRRNELRNMFRNNHINQEDLSRKANYRDRMNDKRSRRVERERGTIPKHDMVELQNELCMQIPLMKMVI